MNDAFDDKNFGAESEMSAQGVDWGKVGDYIVGTFTKARHNVDTQFGENSIYEFLAERGKFHKLTKKVPSETPTTISKGETWNVWGRNDIFNGMLNGLRPGQIVKIEYVGDKDTKMGVLKEVKIFAPKDNEGKRLMNQAWLDDQGISGADDFGKL